MHTIKMQYEFLEVRTLHTKNDNKLITETGEQIISGLWVYKKGTLDDH